MVPDVRYVFDPPNDPRRVLISKARDGGLSVFVRNGEDAAEVFLPTDEINELVVSLIDLS